MCNHKYSIHVYNSTPDDILGRLSQCQFYSETLNEALLDLASKSISKADTTATQFKKIIKLLKGKKDRLVNFYLFEKTAYISVFSDFFSLNNAFDMAKTFFDDMDNMILIVNIADNLMMVEIRNFCNKSLKFVIDLNENHTNQSISSVLEENGISNEMASLLNSNLFELYFLNNCTDPEREAFFKSYTFWEEYII